MVRTVLSEKTLGTFPSGVGRLCNPDSKKANKYACLLKDAKQQTSKRGSGFQVEEKTLEVSLALRAADRSKCVCDRRNSHRAQQ